MQFIILNELAIDPLNAAIDSIMGTVGLALICSFISNNMKYYLPPKGKILVYPGGECSGKFRMGIGSQGNIWIDKG